MNQSLFKFLNLILCIPFKFLSKLYSSKIFDEKDNVLAIYFFWQRFIINTVDFREQRIESTELIR